jgi:hypothetical protein
VIGRTSIRINAKAFLAFAGWVLSTFILALVGSWVIAASVCLCSSKFTLRLADFTCGHNAGYPLALFFLILLPVFAVILPKLFKALR